MRLHSLLVLFLVVGILFFACQKNEKKIHFLLISSDQVEAEPYLGEIVMLDNFKKYQLTDTKDLTWLDEDSLKQFTSVILNHISLDELNYLQINALERFLEAGGGCLGIGLKASIASRFKSSLLYAFFSKDSSYLSPVSNDQFNIYSFGKGQFVSLNDEYALPGPDKQLLTSSISRLADGPRQFDYKNLKTALSTPDYWFAIDTLSMSFNEPLELEILPNGDVLFIERGGAVKMYKAKYEKVVLIGQLAVISTESNGLNGMALAPHFKDNGLVYFSYLSKFDTSHQRISRFRIRQDSLDVASEQIIFEIPIDKSNGWHGTNALEFDSKGNLYIAMGDFTLQANHIAGYAQIDERQGKSHHDAQRTSSNTNSLIGKILRIHPEPDGAYTIPEGNLFPEPSDKTKAEIFVMGCRNPYRFSLDPHTDVLYFGEVGPDAWENGEKGPRGYDELNVVKKAGFYGWPYSVADNKAYYDFDYENNRVGAAFDPLQPANNSPNNSGLVELPPAQQPVVWYPKGESKEFPSLGSGGMNIMVGPKYYANDYPESAVKFPSHYNDKLFIYDWVRNWIITVELDNEGNLKKIEPFLGGEEFTKIIDMKFGPDGSLYLLEYGSKGYRANEDASIKRISYAEGRPKPQSDHSQTQKIADLWNQLLPIKAGLEEGRHSLLNQTCLTCHHPSETVIGPSFSQIAERFLIDKNAYDFLPKKIIEGGTGNWPGNIIMPANPNLSEREATAITAYILSFRELTH